MLVRDGVQASVACSFPAVMFFLSLVSVANLRYMLKLSLHVKGSKIQRKQEQITVLNNMTGFSFCNVMTFFFTV